MSVKSVKFSNKQDRQFVRVLRQRVNDYFQKNNISRYANAQMVIKTITLIVMYLIPYSLVLSGWITSPWVNLGMWILMGIATAGIGFSVMHDANHGAYSSNKYVNKILGQVMIFIGGSSQNWKIQHNVLHHSYTNIHDHDEDIDAGPILRFSPNQKWYKFHRAQHIYAWFLYGLMTIMWITTKDIRQLNRYHKEGLLADQGRTLLGAMAELLATRVIYYGYLLVLPLVLSPFPWWQTLIGFLAMHYVLGFILSIVFQPAHVIMDTEFVKIDDQGSVENNWAIHQLQTTANFAPNNKLLSWYVGGLNFQVEHHLFPNICHIHYKRLSKIVQETAKEYGIPYHSLPSFRSALRSHARLLWTLGHKKEKEAVKEEKTAELVG